jgi:carboxymethylenebutenolidase
MIEETLDITTKDGEMETFICHPERGGSSPAVFLLPSGIRRALPRGEIVRRREP